VIYTVVIVDNDEANLARRDAVLIWNIVHVPATLSRTTHDN